MTKKILKLNARLDTSAQNPEIYADRFKNKLIDSLFEQKIIQNYNKG